MPVDTLTLLIVAGLAAERAYFYWQREPPLVAPKPPETKKPHTKKPHRKQPSGPPERPSKDNSLEELSRYPSVKRTD
jgi:hypothetical protein